MRLTGSRVYYRPTPPKMPPGVVELMEGLTKEVLKHNPTDVYGFCASHMQHLLEIRDGPLLKKTLSLEDKISKAQKKIRQRAEKRREEYDKNVVLQQQQSQNETDERLNSNKDEVTSPEPGHHEAIKVHKMPVDLKQDLVNSSEIEISHELRANETKDNPQIENVTNDETKISDEIKPSNIDETQNLNNISTNDNNINELISQPNENNVYIKDASDSIVRDANIHNNGSENEEEQNVSANNTDQQNDAVNNKQEQIPEIHINDTVEQNVEVGENNSVNIDEQQIPKTNTDNQSLYVQENYIEINENTPVVISNDSKLHVELNSVTKSEASPSSESNENFLNGTANLEIHGAPGTADSNKVDSNAINKHKEADAVIHIDADSSQTKDVDVQPSNEIGVNNLLISDEDVEKCEISAPSASNLVVGTEDKVEIKDFVIPQVQPSEESNKENNHLPQPVTEDAIEITHPNDVKNETAIDPHEVNEEKNGLNISIPGDEEITVHNDLKQGNLNELYMKSSSVTITDPEDGSSNTENLSTKLVDNTYIITTSSDNQGMENIAPHADTENENNNSNVDLETAAITIQKVFRSFLFKSRASTFDGNDEENFIDEEDTDQKEENDFPIPSNITLERRPHGITRMDTVLQTVNEEKSLSLSTDDSSTLSSAATIIQAHVRGFLVRNKLNLNKTLSTNSFPASNSNDPSLTSLENDTDLHKNKTVLNIHIVPEGGNFLSRDESLITSMELSLDGSPPSSINLHPLGYDKSERRKQLKREDAIQSISPPSNNSGKLSEDVDSVKEILMNDNSATLEQHVAESNMIHGVDEETAIASENITPAETATPQAIARSTDMLSNSQINTDTATKESKHSLTKISSDEMDVVTPFISNEDKNSPDSKLMHSGEFHDLVLPTRVSRSDTTVVSEFKSVLVYFLLWNPS